MNTDTQRHPLILALDAGGRPLEWMHWRVAVLLVIREEIQWTTGEAFNVYGGTNNASGVRSSVGLNTIMAVRNAKANSLENLTPALTNVSLFRRDRHTCLYCGAVLPPAYLTRDHVVPQSRGGRDIWLNVVSACHPCNQFKADQTPDEANMPLLALPFAPSRIEALVLANRRILADQMVFLEHHLPSQVAVGR